MEVDGRDIAGNRVGAAPPWATIVVGEAPSRTSDPHEPLLGGRSGRLLAELAGLEPYRFGCLLRCVNLLPVYPGPDKVRQMRTAGAVLRPRLWGRRAMLLGRTVARSVGCGDQPFLTWVDTGSFDAVVLPHPSGENRLWNDALRARVAGVLRAEVARAAEGMRADLPAGCRMPWLDALVQS